MTTNLEKTSDPSLELILRKLAANDGAQKYRTSFLVRRIEHRMRAKGVKSYQEYAGLLSRDPFEHAALKSLFSVTVTEFFRDGEFFELLKTKLLPSLARSGKIKIWCAGCATGEEPYSVAILASESLGSSDGFEIFATDINPDSIRFAESGMYEEKSLKNVPEDLKAKYFHKVAGRESWQVGREIREAVTFGIGDLDKVAPPASDLDMILCRNVMIYFDRTSRENLLKKFCNALKPKGYFVMGQSEIMTGKAFSLFKTAWPKERVYQKS